MKTKYFIHKSLALLCKRKGISLRDLSKKARVPQSTLQGWTYEEAKPENLDALKRVADFFDVSLDYLLFGDTRQRQSLETLPSDILLEGLFRIKLERIKEKE